MVHPRPQTPQGESVAKPETPLLIILSIAHVYQHTNLTSIKRIFMMGCEGTSGPTIQFSGICVSSRLNSKLLMTMFHSKVVNYTLFIFTNSRHRSPPFTPLHSMSSAISPMWNNLAFVCIQKNIARRKHIPLFRYINLQNNNKLRIKKRITS